MNWYKRAASDSILQELILQVKDTYPGQDIPAEALDRYRQQSDENVRSQIEWLKQEKARDIRYREQRQEADQHQKWIEDVPPEIYQIGGTKATDSYTHCMSGPVEKVQEIIRQNGGLPLTQGLGNVGYDDATLQDYNNIFAGCDETWAAILARDYDYSGELVYVTFGDLPEDFYVADDPNPMDKTNLPSSYVILSKQSVIPSQNIENIEDGGTWEGVLSRRPDIENEFGDEGFD
jgi:hypothetical protein